MKCVNIRVLVYIEMHGVHASSRRKLHCLSRLTHISDSPGWVPVLFRGAPAKISAVNTRMKLVKARKFIDHLSADTARLSKSSACAHKHQLFWRHSNAYRDRTHTHTHTHRQYEVGKNLSLLYLLSFCLFLSICTLRASQSLFYTWVF